MGANSKLGDWILTKFKLIQALIVVLIICKNEEDPFKIESTRVVEHFSHYKSIGIFPNAHEQVTHSPWSDPAEFRTHPRYCGFTCCLQE